MHDQTVLSFQMAKANAMKKANSRIVLLWVPHNAGFQCKNHTDTLHL